MHRNDWLVSTSRLHPSWQCNLIWQLGMCLPHHRWVRQDPATGSHGYITLLCSPCLSRTPEIHGTAVTGRCLPAGHTLPILEWTLCQASHSYHLPGFKTPLSSPLPLPWYHHTQVKSQGDNHLPLWFSSSELIIPHSKSNTHGPQDDFCPQFIRAGLMNCSYFWAITDRISGI